MIVKDRKTGEGKFGLPGPLDGFRGLHWAAGSWPEVPTSRRPRGAQARPSRPPRSGGRISPGQPAQGAPPSGDGGRPEALAVICWGPVL